MSRLQGAELSHTISLVRWFQYTILPLVAACQRTLFGRQNFKISDENKPWMITYAACAAKVVRTSSGRSGTLRNRLSM